MTTRRVTVLTCLAAVLLSVMMSITPTPGRAEDAAPARPRPPDGAKRVGDLIDEPYAHVDTWPLGMLPGRRTDPFVPLDVAMDEDGRRYVADDRSDEITVEDPVTGIVTDWPREIPEYDACSTHPVVVLPLRRASSVLVLWSVTPHDGQDVLPILEERQRDGRIVRRLPLVADDIAEDRVSGDLLIAFKGAISRVHWPSLDSVGPPISFIGRLAPNSLAANPERIARLFGGVVRVLDVATARESGRLTLPADSYALSVTSDDDGRFWAVSTSRGEPSRPAITLYSTLGAAVATWSMEALGARVGVRTLSAAALDVRLHAGQQPELLALLSDNLYRVYHFAACDALGPTCTAPDVRTGGSTARDLSGRNCPSVDDPLITARDDGGLLAYSGAGGQLIELDPAGTPRLVGNLTAVPLDITMDKLGGAVMILRPMDEVTHTVVARFPSEVLAAGGVLGPSWQVPCDCSSQPALAADGRRVFVAQMLAGQVAVLDLATGVQQDVLRPSTSNGLWPIDVATTADDWLWTADVPNAEVQGWPPSLAGASTRWPAGFLAGPWRLATGALADGMLLVAIQLTDGTIEIHGADGNVLSRFDPQLDDRFRVGPPVLGRDGRVYVIDATSRSIRLFEPRPAPSTPAFPAPTPTPAPSTCKLKGDKIAGPRQIVLGQTATVTLTLAADCPPRARAVGADIVLVLDTSSSMNADNKIGAAVEAATEFATFLDTSRHQLALVTFADQAGVRVSMTRDSVAVIGALEAVRTARNDGGTDIAAGVSLADDVLAAGARPGALPVMIVLTDGQSERAPALARAEAARARGVRIYTIGLGSDADRELLIAMANGRYFPAPTNGELFPIYREILRLVNTSLAGNLAIDDEMGPDVRFEPSSSAPPAIELVDRLRWGRSNLSTDGITLTYRVRPVRTGLVPTNRLAVARYTDADGVDRDYTFPIPEIMVIAPTPEPRPVYLPVALSERCTPLQRRVDVALILDASTSMAEPAGGATQGSKLDAARAAARRFLDALRLDLGDQAAIVTFNAQATVVQELTDDRTRLDAGLEAIVLAQLTRPQRGIAVAVGALGEARHRPANGRILILLTDGRSNPEPPEVGVEAAAAAKAGGHLIFTVALGADVDRAALTAMASTPDYAFQALDGASLGDIFVRIAGAIPCTIDAFWGRR